MIVAHEVTNVGHDRDQLANMAHLAKQASGERKLIALAARGYYEGYEILKCEQAGIAALVPKPMTSNNLAAGRFDKRDFVYDEHKDEYRCPAARVPSIVPRGSKTARRCTGIGPPHVLHAR